jgi:hypothetical protein
MQSDVLQSLIHLLGGSPTLWLAALVLAIALWTTVQQRRRLRQLEQQLDVMRNDIRALTTAAMGVGGRVLELERRQRRLAERQEQQVDIYESANQPYEHAIQMARHGSGVDELVEVCGVSKNEAELITMMHRLDEAS